MHPGFAGKKKTHVILTMTSRHVLNNNLPILGNSGKIGNKFECSQGVDFGPINKASAKPPRARDISISRGHPLVW